MTEEMTKIELRLSCSNLPNLDWFSKTDCKIFCYALPSRLHLKQNLNQKDLPVVQSYDLLGKTETISDNLNPVFSTPIIADYRFEEEQLLRFILVDIDNESANLKDHDYIGYAQTSIADILMKGKITLPIENKDRQFETKCFLTIAAEELVKNNNHELVFSVKMKVPGKGLFNMGRPDPFIKAFRDREDGAVVAVWTSAYINNTVDPFYKNQKVKLVEFCNGDTSRLITFKVFDWEPSGDHIYIGEVSLSVQEMLQGQGKELPLMKYNYREKSPERFNHPLEKADKVGFVNFVSASVIEKHSFIDYLNTGTQLNFNVAIDFTQSNGDPNLPNSLHYRGTPSQQAAGFMNDYEHAIVAVGTVIQQYDSDKVFPAFGFGAKLPNGEVSHSWPINGNPSNPGCVGVEGILEAYRMALKNVSLYGPTNFSPFIRARCDEVAEEVAKQKRYNPKGPWTYQVLLIITDGEITDMDSTIRSIIKASSLPVSIIIIGVGNGSTFENMKVLDGDDEPLNDGNGNFVARDIVQFVPMREIKASKDDVYAYQKELAAAVLEELPEQVVDWFTHAGIKPSK